MRTIGTALRQRMTRSWDYLRRHMAEESAVLFMMEQYRFERYTECAAVMRTIVERNKRDARELKRQKRLKHDKGRERTCRGGSSLGR